MNHLPYIISVISGLFLPKSTRPAQDFQWSTCSPHHSSLSHPVTHSTNWAAQMPPPVSGHQLGKAERPGGGCWESLIHPDWHSCGTSAGSLCHSQRGDRTAGAVSKLHCTKIAPVPAWPSAGRALAGARWQRYISTFAPHCTAANWPCPLPAAAAST